MLVRKIIFCILPLHSLTRAQGLQGPLDDYANRSQACIKADTPDMYISQVRLLLQFRRVSCKMKLN